MVDDPKRRADPNETVIEKLFSQIDLGLEQARRGELLDGEEVFRDLEQRGETQPGPNQPETFPDEELQPRTPLGRELWELRKRIVASGEPMLDADAIEREVAERRGGVSEKD